MRLAILRGSSQYVNPHFYNVQEIGLGRELARRGWQVRIISSGPGAAPVKPAPGVEWIECERVGISRNIGWPKGAIDLIREFEPNIVQVQDILTPSSLLALAVKKKLRVPLVMSLGEYEDGSLKRAAAARAIAQLMRHECEAVLCKTTAAASYANKLGLRNVRVCPVGIHVENYVDTSSGEPQEWETQLSRRLSQGMILLCHVGRLDKMDNIPFLLRVLKELPERYHMVIAGEPRRYGIACAEQIGVLDRVTFLGRVDNRLIPRLFRLVHVTLACSPFEPFGLSVAESLYHGCPVVAHPTGGILDMIVDGFNGRYVPAREPDVWARFVEDTTKPDTLELLRKNATVDRHELTWEHRVTNYVHVYNDVIGGVSREGAGFVV